MLHKRPSKNSFNKSLNVTKEGSSTTSAGGPILALAAHLQKWETTRSSSLHDLTSWLEEVLCHEVFMGYHQHFTLYYMAFLSSFFIIKK